MELDGLYDIETDATPNLGTRKRPRATPILPLSPYSRGILFLVQFTVGLLLVYRVALRFIFVYPHHRPNWYNLSYQMIDVVMGLAFCAMAGDLLVSRGVTRRHAKMAAVIAIAFSGMNTLYAYHRYWDVLHSGLGILNLADAARIMILFSGYYLGGRILMGRPVFRRSTFAIVSAILVTHAANYVFYFKLPYYLLVQPESFMQTRMMIQAIQFSVLIIAAVFSLSIAMGRTSSGSSGLTALPGYVRAGVMLFGLHFVLWGLQEVVVNTGPLWDSFALHPSFALAPAILMVKGVSIALASLYPWKLPLAGLPGSTRSELSLGLSDEPQRSIFALYLNWAS